MFQKLLRHWSLFEELVERDSKEISLPFSSVPVTLFHKAGHILFVCRFALKSLASVKRFQASIVMLCCTLADAGRWLPNGHTFSAAAVFRGKV